MRKSQFTKLSAALLFPCVVLAQTGNVPSTQKTIEISATEKVEVSAETATLKIGYQNQASSKDAVYAENTRIANQIVQALLDAGVPKDAMETESLSLARDENRFGAKPQQAASFSASQEWLIHSKASEAQKIVDIAVAAGANQIESVDWTVNDPKKLEDKAYAAALARARTIAEQAATQAGVKLGEIISIVNSANSTSMFPRQGLASPMMAVEVSAAKMKLPMLRLEPGTVEREASVTVTYGIAP
jgi:uncharacterized protein YggE